MKDLLLQKPALFGDVHLKVVFHAVLTGQDILTARQKLHAALAAASGPAARTVQGNASLPRRLQQGSSRMNRDNPVVRPKMYRVATDGKPTINNKTRIIV
jgi:hypothetical protein